MINLDTKSQIIVSVSDARCSDSLEDVLVTYSLGSCIGVALYDPTTRIAGLLHFQLPSSLADPDRARQKPLMYADTGMTLLIDEMEGLGAQRRRMKVRLAGAAQILEDAGVFNIGRRNHTAVRKLLWQYGMLIDGEEIGGTSPRNLYLTVADGLVTVKSGQQTRTL